jgi:hypothetical protein
MRRHALAFRFVLVRWGSLSMVSPVGAVEDPPELESGRQPPDTGTPTPVSLNRTVHQDDPHLALSARCASNRANWPCYFNEMENGYRLFEQTVSSKG